MALGNDGAAHRGALRAGGLTVAVLAGGADVCYPPQHRSLMGDIMLSGAIVSEYPPGTEPKGTHYHARNRIISGLSVAAVIVEAGGYRSGALITARACARSGARCVWYPARWTRRSPRRAMSWDRKGEASCCAARRHWCGRTAACFGVRPAEHRVQQAFARQTGEHPVLGAKSAWGGISKREDQAVARRRQAEEKASAPSEGKAPLPDGLREDERRIAELVMQGTTRSKS